MKLTLFWSQKRMASCFDFRMRTSSFDLHQLAQRRKLAKFGKLFRSRSEGSVRIDSPKSSPKTSPKASPKGSPTTITTRRRFVRVVRDDESAGEEYDNPHIIRRYTQEYVRQQWAQRSSETYDEDSLPYVVSGPTILKKHASGDRTESPTGCGAGGGAGGDQSPAQKHASFKDEVQVIEFDRKGKVKACSVCTRITRLQDSDEESETPDICEVCLKRGLDDCQHLSSESETSDTESKDTRDCVESVTDSRPSVTDSRPSVTDSRPSVTDSRPSVTDSRPSVTDSRPSVTDSRPSVTDSKPSATDSKPSAMDSKSSAMDSKSSAGDSTTSAGDSTTSAGDRKLALDGEFKENADSVSEKNTGSNSIVKKLVSAHIELQESERLRGRPALVSADG